jgi:Uma2 family endonuclease
MADVMTASPASTGPACTPTRRRFSVADYHRMGETGILPPDARVELIEGEVLEMAPIGPPHAGIVNRLTRMLVRGAGDAALVSAGNPVVLDHWSEPQPDLALLRPGADSLSRLPRTDDVLLLVEVSDSTLRFDRAVKLPLYARRGVCEVWIVDVRERRVEVHRGLRDGEYHDSSTHGPDEVIAPVALPSLTVALREVFAP